MSDAVKQGFLSEKDVDVTLKRLFTARFRLGLFDPPEMVKYAQTPDSEIDSDAHRQLALKTARESIVLLKNDGVLPLKAGITKIAVVGPLASSLHVLEGNYSGTPSRSTTALDGIRKQFAVGSGVIHAGHKLLARRQSQCHLQLFPRRMENRDSRPSISRTRLHRHTRLVRVEKDVNYDFAPGTADQDENLFGTLDGFPHTGGVGNLSIGLGRSPRPPLAGRQNDCG